MSALAPTLQAFFTDRLITQRHASPHTIASYRNTMRLLLQFAQKRLRTPAAELDLGQLDADLIGAFLEHLEQERREHHRDPQRQAGSDPLALQVRQPAPSRARRADRARARDPTQTPRPNAHHPPHRHRDRRAAQRA